MDEKVTRQEGIRRKARKSGRHLTSRPNRRKAIQHEGELELQTRSYETCRTTQKPDREEQLTNDEQYGLTDRIVISTLTNRKMDI